MAGSDRLDAFLGMLESGQDSPLLRYSIGLEYLNREQPAEAVAHFRYCLELDPTYSAAYKMLAQALDGLGQTEACRETLEAGMAHAQENGDRQARKEMQVLRKRLDKGQALRKE